MLLEERLVSNADNIVLIVKGGIGRNIMATAVVRAIKKAYPDKPLSVIAGCPDVFLRSPHIKRVMRMGQSVYFFQDFMLDKKTIFLDVEPYHHFDYIYNRRHFVECWCDMLGIPNDGIYPEIHFSESEKRMAQLFLEKFDRPMVLLQHCGGKFPKDKTEKEDIISRAGMYRRDLPKEEVDKLVDELIKMGYMVGSVQHENQYCPAKAEKINFPVRAIIALGLFSKGFIGIDSFLMHGMAAIKSKGVVCWGGTHPSALSYPHFDNLMRKVCPTPMCHRPNSYLFDVEPTGFMWDCPHDAKCMKYTAKQILEAFKKRFGGKDGGGKITDNQKGKARKKEKRLDTNSGGSGKSGRTSERAACPCK